MKKRILALFLAAVMVMTLVPAVFAADSDFVIEDGVLTEYEGPGGDVVIPNGVTSIGQFAFSECLNLTHVEVPDSVTTIKDSAFYGCTALTGISIPESVISIECCAFEGCRSLTSIAIPTGVTSIEEDTFYDCAALTSVTIPESVTSIGGGAFTGCSSLASVTIPASVTSIGPDAFYPCAALRDIYYGGSESQWGKIVCETIDWQTGSQVTLFADGGQEIAGLDGVAIHYNSGASDPGPGPVVPDPDEPAFTDVSANAYYADAVKWAVETEVTNGYPDGRFDPNGNCTRAQIVTFLWRAYGEQEPQSMVSPFSDVTDPNAYYYKAVLWAVEKKITTGATAATFDPNGTCTRGQAVTFQWRAADKPSASGGKTFGDVADGAFYADAVKWAVENKITTGATATTFDPNGTCTRGQIVTFLYRDLA